jgi:hypothetical protein
MKPPLKGLRRLRPRPRAEPRSVAPGPGAEEAKPAKAKPAKAKPAKAKPAKAKTAKPAKGKPPPAVTVGDLREGYIGRVVRGRSFAEVGQPADVREEKVSVAHSFGAAAVTMIVLADLGDADERSFSERMSYFGVRDLVRLVAETERLEAPGGGRFDVLHCSGVLHRVPDPRAFLSVLHAITGEHLVLGSPVAGEPEAATSLVVPAVRDRAGQGPPTSWGWLPTVHAMKAMCTSAGFHVEEGAAYEDPAFHNNAYAMLLSRRDVIAPPPGLSPDA